MIITSNLWAYLTHFLHIFMFFELQYVHYLIHILFRFTIFIFIFFTVHFEQFRRQRRPIILHSLLIPTPYGVPDNQP